MGMCAITALAKGAPAPTSLRWWGLLALACLILLAPGRSALGATEDPPRPFPRMAQTIGELVSRFYYDQSRIEPQVMLERALRALEGAEISLKGRWQDAEIEILAKGQRQKFAVGSVDGLGAVMRVLEDIREGLPAFGFSPERSRELAYAMLNGALSTLDPHTVIMAPRRASEFSEDIAGEFQGVGAYLNQEMGIIRIDRVMPGLPAELAGVRDGDIILAVDGEPTVGLSLAQAVSRIRGPKGTTVVLTVEREGEKKPIDIPTVRDLIEPPTLVSWQEDGIAYVRLDEFNRNSNRQLYVALAALQQSGPLRGLVLDLRFNGGGLLRQAHMIADMFLTHSREVVRTVSLGRPPQSLTSSRNVVLAEVPMVVLVGPGSASASEILAGALQLNQRAVVVGNPTYGKGSVQTVRPLVDASNLKFTIQEYQLAGGVSIQGQGVQPDLRLTRRSVDENGNVDLVPYTFAAESDLEFALIGAAPEGETEGTLRLAWVAEHQDEEAQRASRISARNFRPDLEARVIIDVLDRATAGANLQAEMAQAWLEDRMRSHTLSLLEPALRERQKIEVERLSAALAAAPRPVHWGDAFAGAEVSQLNLEYMGPESLSPGEEAELRFRVHNPSDQAIGQIYGIIRADLASPLWESELIVGEIPAQDAVEAVIPFRVPPRLHPGHEVFTLELRQDGRSQPILKLPVSVAIADEPRPHFSWSWSVRDVDGAAIAPLHLDQDRQLQLTVTNDGNGVSMPLQLFVFKDDDPFVSLRSGRFTLDPLEPGASVTVDVPFSITSTPPRGYRQRTPPAQVSLQVHGEEDLPRGRDARHRVTFFHTLQLSVGEENLEALQGSVAKPMIALEGIAYQGPQAQVTVRVEDDNLQYLALFQGRRKIALESFGGSAVSDQRQFTIQLEEGLNELRLLASDADDVMAALPLRLWGPDIALAGRPMPVGDRQ